MCVGGGGGERGRREGNILQEAARRLIKLLFGHFKIDIYSSDHSN